MTSARLLALSALVSCSIATAQVHPLRGGVESVPGTNRFVLACTDVPVVSTAVDLRQLVAKKHHLAMKVVDVGTPGQPVLDILDITEASRVLDMGDLLLGQASTWEVRGAPGGIAFVFVGLRSGTGFVPLGSAGALLLGPGAGTLASGPIDSTGSFRFTFTTPFLQGLFDLEIASQALVAGGGLDPFLSNADCRRVGR